MRSVNLLPRDHLGDGRKTPPLPVLVGCIGTVLVTAALALMFLSASSSVAAKKRALIDVEAQYSALPAPATAPSVDSKIPQLTQTRVSALATALGQRIAWDRLLREVSQVVPSDVWLVTLNAQSPALAPAVTPSTTPGVGATLPQGFTVSGCTYSQDSVARFLARLDIVPDLSDMTLGKSASTSGASSAGGGTCPANMFAFTLQGNVRAAGATTS